MELNIQRREYTNTTRLYDMVFTEDNVKELNTIIEESYSNPIKITEEEFIAAANSQPFDREYVELTITNSKGNTYTETLVEIIKDYISDTLWECEYEVIESETMDYEDEVVDD